MSAGEETIHEGANAPPSSMNVESLTSSSKDLPPPTPSKPAVEILQPNATLYVSNIEWSIKKNILRRALLALFERHGKVIEVVTLRREGLRGQAWIIFEEITSATAAQRAEDGFKFFGKELKVNYAKEKSDRIAKQDGSYVPKDRRAKRSRVMNHPPSGPDANMTMATETKVDDPSSLYPPAESQSSSDVPSPPLSAPPPPPPNAASENNLQGDQDADAPDATVELSPPSNILFAQDLPTECNEMMLAMLFRQYLGYKEVRIPRQGLAFVEFDDEPHATLALRGLNGFQLTTTDTLDLKYGKIG